MNEFIDTIGRRFYHIRAFNFQFLAILKKRIGIEFGDVHYGFVLSLGAGKHLVFSGISVT